MTIALHKPRGVVTTRRDPQQRPTVYDAIRDLDAHVVPVGRLDFATSGLILMTNDTRLADWLTDPVNAVPRVYLVTARGRVTEEEAATLERGLFDPGHSQGRGEELRAESVIIRKASNRESHLVMTLVEGKNREIRRLLSAVGHEVTRLRRVQIGGVSSTICRRAPGVIWRATNWRAPSRADRRPTRPTRPRGARLAAVSAYRHENGAGPFRYTKKSRIN